MKYFLVEYLIILYYFGLKKNLVLKSCIRILI